METSTNRHVIVSASGGMDSSTVLLKALATYDTVTAISFDYGQKHRVELKRAQELVDYLNQKPELASKLTYKVIKLDGLVDLLHSTLVQGGSEVPEGYYAESCMKDTVVPNRNKIFSSIAQAIALSIVQKTGDLCDIALGIHAGDHCFSKDTNILTPSGLKTVDTLKIGDVVYSYNLDTHQWEEDIVDDIIKKGIVDIITKIKTFSGDLKLTDEHKVYRLKLLDFHNIHGYEKTVELVKVSELREGDRLLQPTGIIQKDLPSTGSTIDLLPIVESIMKKYDSAPKLNEEEGYIWLGGQSDLYKNKRLPRFIDAEAFVVCMAWYIAEGHSSKTPYTSVNGKSRLSASFSQSLKANLDKVEYIIQTAKKGELPVKYEFSKATYNGIPKEVVVYMSNILAVLAKETGSHSDVKHIPDWLMEPLLGSLELREAFLYTLGIADGFNTEKLNKGFCSKSKKLLEQFTTLIQLSGYHFSVTKETPTGVQYIGYSKTNQKRASISLGNLKFTEINSISQEVYNDHVYDITVRKNHNFVAGRYGQVLISNSVYPDCRQEFRDIDEQAFREGNWDAERVSYWTPYLLVTKVEILKDGLELCKELGLDFNEVYKRTNTSYKPYPSGNSDYKSASSIERILAFTEIGIADPVQYEDETGLVSWEIASAHAKEVEDEFLAEQAGHGRDCHI